MYGYLNYVWILKLCMDTCLSIHCYIKINILLLILKFYILIHIINIDNMYVNVKLKCTVERSH